MKVIVLGAGLQGIATALDLAWNPNIEEITLADLDLDRANYVAELCNEKYGERAHAVQCDVSDMDALVSVIRGHDLVINEVNYYFNCHVMEACLKAKVNYMDIGGLYVETIKQVKYKEQFEKAGLIAIIGIGGTPGVTNVCARWAADQLDRIDSIRVACGCDDWSSSTKALEVTYAIETIMDEFYMKPIQFIDGEYVEVMPRSGGEVIQYSNPVGSMYSYFIMHSEIGTLPKVYKEKGIQNCTFRIGFPDSIKEKLEFLHGLGFSRSDEVTVDGQNMKPVRVLKKMMELQPEDPNATINDCDVIKTVVFGKKDGQNIEFELEAVCRPVKEWPELLGAQVYIGGAPAWTAELLRRGEIAGAGVFAPEEIVPPEPFFQEAAKREIYIRASKKMLLGVNDWEAARRKERIDQGL